MLGASVPTRTLFAAAVLAAALTTPTVTAAAETPTPTSSGLRLVSGGAVAVAVSPSAAAAATEQASPATTPTAPMVGVLRRVGEPAPEGPQGGRSRPATPPSATPPPTETPQPTATATPTQTPVELPTFEPAKDSVQGHVEGNRLLLEVPFRTQFDGTEFPASNCGPTSLAMVLDAFGVASKTFQVRNLVNVLANNFDVEAGTSLDALSWIANQAGLRVIGLYADAGYHKWTIDDVRDEVRHGHPVITLVKYRDLPGANLSNAEVDHYVVIVGLDGADLLINDPALPPALGYRRVLTVEQLEKAWADSSIPRQAVGYAATENVHELDLPDPATPSATPAPTRLADDQRDTWRLPGQLGTPGSVPSAPTPTAAPEIPVPPPRPTATPRPEATASPTVAAEPSPWMKATRSVDPETPGHQTPPSRGQDLGLLSLLSLPLFFVRSVVRFPS
jgi:hypothetical protein